MEWSAHLNIYDGNSDRVVNKSQAIVHFWFNLTLVKHDRRKREHPTAIKYSIVFPVSSSMDHILLEIWRDPKDVQSVKTQ